MILGFISFYFVTTLLYHRSGSFFDFLPYFLMENLFLSFVWSFWIAQFINKQSNINDGTLSNFVVCHQIKIETLDLMSFETLEIMFM